MPVITSSTCPNGPANGTSRPNTAAVMIAAISAPQLRTCSEASKGPTANTVAGIAAGRSPPKPMNIAGHASTTTSTPAVTTAARSSQGARPSSHGRAACVSRANSPIMAARSLAAAPITAATAATTARASAATPTASSLSPAPAAPARRGRMEGESVTSAPPLPAPLSAPRVRAPVVRLVPDQTMIMA